MELVKVLLLDLGDGARPPVDICPSDFTLILMSSVFPGTSELDALPPADLFPADPAATRSEEIKESSAATPAPGLRVWG